ncbi:hypothetical protein BayCH28_24675 [Mycolicibacterium sp. CH28]|uniref:malonate decarboxylase subunit alpha n=1 Tax=Mycolicibacterium sp. CH28 TaxID=2512237 RepID=UPI00108168B5|nr:malonate decarboxylase subunit alpha [Mycolicibacterium sp. CH28]TGD84602.1 hypothetical protein BayCH28_24675 [Mycolicibacterium sp. CH28]
MRRWDSRRTAKAERIAAGRNYVDGKIIDAQYIIDFLHSVVRTGDRAALEGDNQKQADFLSRSLAGCDPSRLSDLHMLISSVSRQEHLDLFDRRIAAKLDLAHAGPQSVRIAQMVEDGTVQIGAIHTYVELYARMFVDLVPDVALLCASAADRDGNLYTGPNTEDTPTIAEAAAFHDGVVIVQVDEVVDSGALPRVDIPWGPTGSVGFELATGIPTATDASDLDVIVRVRHVDSSTLQRLCAIHDRLAQQAVRVDCQVDTQAGAIALGELVSAGTEVLVRTPAGPRLLPRAAALS